MPWDDFRDPRTDLDPLRKALMKSVPQYVDSRVQIIKDYTFDVSNAGPVVKMRNKNISIHMSKKFRYESKYQSHRFTGKNNVPTGVAYDDAEYLRKDEDRTHGFRNHHPPLQKMFCVIMAHPVIPGLLGQEPPELENMKALGELSEQMRKERRGVLPVRHMGYSPYATHYKLKPSEKRPDVSDVIDDPDPNQLELPEWYDPTDEGQYAQPPEENPAEEIVRLENRKRYMKMKRDQAIKEATERYYRSERQRIDDAKAAQAEEEANEADDLDEEKNDEIMYNPSFVGYPFAWMEMSPKITLCFRNNRDSRPRLS
jgi:hypothetical protein